MSGRAKALAVGMSGVTALVVGVYLADFPTLWLPELAIPLGPAAYWQYLRALDLPQVAPYVGRIRLAGYLGFGLPLVAWTVLAILILKPRAPAFHGNARFASRADLARAGLLKQSTDDLQEKDIAASGTGSDCGADSG